MQLFCTPVGQVPGRLKNLLLSLQFVASLFDSGTLDKFHHLNDETPLGSHPSITLVYVEPIMTNYMIVRQKVTNFAYLQKAFDRLRADREAAGLTDIGQFCAADEHDVVIVVMEVAEVSRAKKYWDAEVLAQGRADASIVGPIEAKSDQVWLTDGLVKDRLAKPKRRRRPVDSEAGT
jgi:hypothetical protein